MEALAFNYTRLDAETRIVVQQRTTEIRTLVKRSAQDIIEIGQKLIEVKERLGHGSFGSWLAAEFEWSDQTALNYMNVARHFREIPNGLEFAPRALYMLASPSTPEAARVQAIEVATSGEPVTHGKAQEIVEAHKPSTQPVERAAAVKAKPETPFQTGATATVLSEKSPYYGQSVTIQNVSNVVVEAKTESGETIPLFTNELTTDEDTSRTVEKTWSAQPKTTKPSHYEALELENVVLTQRCELLEQQLTKAIALLQQFRSTPQIRAVVAEASELLA